MPQYATIRLHIIVVQHCLQLKHDDELDPVKVISNSASCI